MRTHNKDTQKSLLNSIGCWVHHVFILLSVYLRQLSTRGISFFSVSTLLIFMAVSIQKCCWKLYPQANIDLIPLLSLSHRNKQSRHWCKPDRVYSCGLLSWWLYYLQAPKTHLIQSIRDFSNEITIHFAWPHCQKPTNSNKVSHVVMSRSTCEDSQWRN